MDEKQIEGGAGPALAAHSKDGSAPGPTSASSATGNTNEKSDSATPDVSDTVNRLSGQARDAASRVASSVADAADSAGKRLSEQSGRAAEQTAEFVREQPVIALVVTGTVCLLLGLLLGQRGDASRRRDMSRLKKLASSSRDRRW